MTTNAATGARSSARTGGRLLVDQLVHQRSDRIFTVPGESFLAVLDALYDVDAIDLVVCRQEGGAAYMACADGVLTGRPGIAFVTRGPGATNAAIGVHVAMQDSVPMILFIGDVDRSTRDREAFQEIDFAAMFTPVAKWAARIDDVARIPEYVARAFRVAMSGRPGPVVLALPEDMLTDRTDAVDRGLVTPVEQPCDPAALCALLEMLDGARRPLAIVGGAGWDAQCGRDFAHFATGAGLPVAAAFRRQDAIANDCAVYAGNLGYGPSPALVARVRSADLLIVVGARLGEATTDGYRLVTPEHPGQLLVHVHPDPGEIDRVFRTDLAICASMRRFCSAVAQSTDRHTGDLRPNVPQAPDAGAAAHAEWLAWSTPTPRDFTLDLGVCVTAMRDALPRDTIICNGAGNYSGWWHRYWHYAGTVSQLAPTAGAMGFGLPAAIAAARRYPERCVVALAGDGCFLMNGQELATAVALGLSLIVIIIDNGSYGTIRMHQEREYPRRISGTALANPDFAALTRSFGCWARTVTDTAGFAPALAAAMVAGGVRVLHLRTTIEAITPSLILDDLLAADTVPMTSAGLT